MCVPSIPINKMSTAEADGQFRFVGAHFPGNLQILFDVNLYYLYTHGISFCGTPRGQQNKHVICTTIIYTKILHQKPQILCSSSRADRRN